MNLKTFNATNVSSSKKETKPFVSLASKSGLFNFNKAACEIIGLKAGNKAEIVFKGRNTKGTEVHVSAIMPDYFLKYLNRDIVEIAKQKQNEGILFFNTIKNQSNQ